MNTTQVKQFHINDHKSIPSLSSYINKASKGEMLDIISNDGTSAQQ